MVDPDSGRVPRAPPYSGTAPGSPLHSAYAAITLSGRASQRARLCMRFSPNFPGHPRAALQPRTWRFGLLPVRSPLLGESLLISVPVLLRWFTSHSVAPRACLLRPRGACLPACGLPHSETRGSKDVCSSPRTIAACRVLHRRPAPPGIRHGPIFAWPYPCSRPRPDPPPGARPEGDTAPFTSSFPLFFLSKTLPHPAPRIAEPENELCGTG